MENNRGEDAPALDHEVAQRLRQALAAAGIGEWELDLRTGVISASPQSFRNYGHADVLPGFTMDHLLRQVHEHDRAPLLQRLEGLRSGGKPLALEYRVFWPDGSLHWMQVHCTVQRDDQGQPRRLVGVAADVTGRKLHEVEMQRLAHHDLLTGLPNRMVLNRHLQELLAAPGAPGFALLMVDLDRFKGFNDSFGHEKGDLLLQEVATRLRAALCPGDLLCRMGGDEFVVVAHGIVAEPDAQAVAARLMQALQHPVTVGAVDAFIGASIGIALSLRQGRDKDELLQHADMAMYRAKAQGRGCHLFYTDEMGEHARRQLALEMALRTALERQELELHYQPRLALDGLAVVGMEALVRWRCPQRGLVAPGDFIPIAEESGLIEPIGEWVLRRACTDTARLTRELQRPLAVSVNVSPRQLRSPRLVAAVRDALADSGLAPQRLELELTESAFIDDVEASRQVFEQIKALGARLALDDFGTGYSSLSYLQRFPIDTIKLDRSFVLHPVHSGASRQQFIQAVRDMAHALDMRVVAEGVEDAQTQRMLQAVGCDEAQGYLFARPLPLAELEAFLRQGDRGGPTAAPSQPACDSACAAAAANALAQR